jgi:HK97 family phage major capsid protein
MSGTNTLAKVIDERRDITRRAAAELAESFDPNNQSQQLDLEQRLADLERYERMATYVASAEEREATSPYRREARHGFLHDVIRSANSGAAGAGADAGERLRRHQAAELDVARAENRAAGTDAFGALVVPQYLLNWFAPKARGARSVVDLLTSPLPDEGMAIDVAKTVTGATGGVQNGDNTTVPTGDIVIGDLGRVPIRTVEASVTASLQTVERTPQATDAIVGGELLGEWAWRTEWFTLNGDGTNGAPLGIRNVPGASTLAYTTSSPTAAGFVAKIGAAATTSEAARKLPADVVFMHPRRWLWLTSRPDVGSVAVSTVPRAGAPAQVVGSILGLDVVLSSAIPTDLGDGEDQDEVIVARAADLKVGETPPAVRTGPADGGVITGVNLSVGVIASSYLVVEARRYPAAIVLVGGTGLNAVAA